MLTVKLLNNEKQKKMIDQTPWEQIQNRLQHPNDPEDELLKSWLSASSDNQTILDDLQVIHSITGNVPESFNAEKDRAWQKVVKRISIKKRQPGLATIMLRVAASILLIALGVGSNYFLQNKQLLNSFTEVYSPYGHKTMILLPDSSQIWLNGNSRLRYRANFRKSRYVELTGEGLFKVTKDPNRLFTVKSENLQLEVYGTTFNVKSYPEDNVSEVALVEGSVGLFHNNQLMKKMVPGEVIAYNARENKFSHPQCDINQITSWRADELVIENETFENVIKYLERWYGVEITLNKSLMGNSKLSFKVKTESLTELLSIIDHITPVSYEISGKQVKITKRIKKEILK